MDSNLPSAETIETALSAAREFAEYIVIREMLEDTDWKQTELDASQIATKYLDRNKPFLFRSAGQWNALEKRAHEIARLVLENEKS